MLNKLKKDVSQRRYIHSVNTMNTARDLAEHYKEDTQKCMLAGLLHDCAKNIVDDEAIEMAKENNIEVDYILKCQTTLLHGKLGRIVAKEKYNITNEEILLAIENHTMGRKNMGMIEKIVFLADFIEPHRFFTGVEEIREAAYQDIDRAIIMALDSTIKSLLSRHSYIHPKTIETRNYYISLKGVI